ncbi:hypothetical protein EMIHUDRAFT_448455 [Emiliania huxleyi CCMP1516]|uniref:Uncharacterized protein n=2 Tax=Emiliania huxleyi TaxID=2903 RepID=A0A0D3I711_EMIH1|nr:hypothetical protein EMIHUDRAFT_448455 [Emiliania huxleyi CCMP1516]EOD07046.1 hypothetical protein EMIHUDRAFT_448455 [Emiliania huxleyi CCMP1516]|eukprot:XP_005759475.1 hypothetical protein EMIHUDRAFT_448455 [Emiliania huxleyi CCMP1516]
MDPAEVPNQSESRRRAARDHQPAFQRGRARAPAALSRRVTAADIMCSVVPAGAELRHVELFGTSRRVGALVRLSMDLRSDSAAARRCPWQQQGRA